MYSVGFPYFVILFRLERFGYRLTLTIAEISEKIRCSSCLLSLFRSFEVLNVDFVALRVKLISFGSAFSGDSEAVADMVQETMLTILKLEKMPENVENYAVITLRHKLCRYFKWRNSRKETGFPESATGSTVEPISPVVVDATAEMAERLEAMDFPPQWKEIIVMVMAGIPACEIATSRNLTLSGYYKVISRIREHARKQVAEE